MLVPWVLHPIRVLVLPERSRLQLLPPARRIAGVQVGLVDHAGAPVAAAVVVPPVARHDAVEVAPELLQRGAIGNRFVHGLAEVAHDCVPVGPSHHKRPLMLGRVHIQP